MCVNIIRYTGTLTQSSFNSNAECVPDAAADVAVVVSAALGCVELPELEPDQEHFSIRGSCDPATGYVVQHVYPGPGCTGTPDIRRQDAWNLGCNWLTTLTPQNGVCTGGQERSISVECTDDDGDDDDALAVAGTDDGDDGMSPGTIAGIVLIIILGIILLRIILGIIWLRSRRREEQDGPAKPLPAAETFMEVDDAVTTTTTAAASNTTANAGYLDMSSAPEHQSAAGDGASDIANVYVDDGGFDVSFLVSTL